MTKFAAEKQAIGYLFQFRYALLAFLKSSSISDIIIEGLDDISFESSGDVYQLVQTKHVTRKANLSDRSTDLWKTIRIWSTHLYKGDIDINNVDLILVTTATPAKNSLAIYLSESKERNVEKALALMESICKETTSEANQSSYEAFSKLSPTQKSKLLNKIKILTSSTNIEETKKEIQDRLEFTTRPEFSEDFFTRLEGWWFNRVIKHLSQKTDTVILRKELSAQIADLAEQYHKDDLPIHFETLTPPEESEIRSSESIFIEQLRLVEVGTERVKHAIADYYKAFHQRSKWVREGNLLVGDLENYENKLISEWSRLFETMKEDVSETSTHAQLVSAGRKIYNQIEQQVQIPIRPRCTEPYVMRGTYHSLSNKGRVGWHPDFETRLKNLFEKALEEAVGSSSPDL